MGVLIWDDFKAHPAIEAAHHSFFIDHLLLPYWTMNSFPLMPVDYAVAIPAISYTLTPLSLSLQMNRGSATILEALVLTTFPSASRVLTTSSPTTKRPRSQANNDTESDSDDPVFFSPRLRRPPLNKNRVKARFFRGKCPRSFTHMTCDVCTNTTPYEPNVNVCKRCVALLKVRNAAFSLCVHPRSQWYSPKTKENEYTMICGECMDMNIMRLEDGHVITL